MALQMRFFQVRELSEECGVSLERHERVAAVRRSVGGRDTSRWRDCTGRRLNLEKNWEAGWERLMPTLMFTILCVMHHLMQGGSLGVTG